MTTNDKANPYRAPLADAHPHGRLDNRPDDRGPATLAESDLLSRYRFWMTILSGFWLVIGFLALVPLAMVVSLAAKHGWRLFDEIELGPVVFAVSGGSWFVLGFFCWRLQRWAVYPGLAIVYFCLWLSFENGFNFGAVFLSVLALLGHMVLYTAGKARAAGLSLQARPLSILELRRVQQGE